MSRRPVTQRQLRRLATLCHSAWGLLPSGASSASGAASHGPARSPHASRLISRRTATSLRLWVMTNEARGAGVDAAATVTIKGTQGEARLLLVPPDGEFRRGSRELFQQTVGVDLGRLRQLEVGINKPGSWLLDRILVAARTPEQQAKVGAMAQAATANSQTHGADLTVQPASAASASEVSSDSKNDTKTASDKQTGAVSLTDTHGRSHLATSKAQQQTSAKAPESASTLFEDEQPASRRIESPNTTSSRSRSSAESAASASGGSQTPSDSSAASPTTKGAPVWTSEQQMYVVQATAAADLAPSAPDFCPVEQRCVFECGKRIQREGTETAPLAVPLRYRDALPSDDFDYGSSKPPVVRAETQQRRKDKERALGIRHSAVALPHPAKVRSGVKGRSLKHEGYAGEDAYAVYVSSRGALLGVADGVRSWEREGINSGEVASGLVKQASLLFAKAVDAPINAFVPKPLSLLTRTWANVQAQGLRGSSTVALIVVDSRAGVLRSASLGDSGYMVFRGINSDSPYKVYGTPQQEHEFGLPYQLGHHANSDAPGDALVHDMNLQRGDVIVVGTDGLFDNLGEMAMVSLLQQSRQPWMAAGALVHAAFDISVDPDAASPWSRWATQELNMPYVGGKQDDITAIVAEVL